MKARGNMDWLLLSLTHNGASCVDFFHVIHLDLFYLIAFSLMLFMDTNINLRFEWKWPIDFFYLLLLNSRNSLVFFKNAKRDKWFRNEDIC